MEPLSDAYFVGGSALRNGGPVDQSLGSSGHCVTRVTILSFLPLASVRQVCMIHDGWYRAAQDSSAWEGAVASWTAECVLQGTSSSSSLSGPSSVLAAPEVAAVVTAMTIPLSFRYPYVWMGCLDVLANRAKLIRSLLDEDEFFKVVGSIFGSMNNRLSLQFPILTVLLRCPAFLTAKVETSARDGYVDNKRRFLYLVANVVRWHEASPCVAHIPWLVEIYRWSALQYPGAFDALLLTPALSLLTQNETVALPLSVVLDLVEITGALLRRHVPLPPATGQQQSSSSLSTSSAGSGTHQDQEKDIFRVLVLVLQSYRHVPLVRLAVADVMASYGPRGIEDLIQAKLRMEVADGVDVMLLAEQQLVSSLSPSEAGS